MLTPISTLLFTLVTLTYDAEAYRILALFPYPLKSHFIAFETLLTELAARGHELTVYTSFVRNTTDPNYKQIDCSHCLEIPSEIFTLEYASSHCKTAFHLLNELAIVTILHENLLKCDPLVKLRKSEETYDLVITETFVSDALLPYAYKFQVPYILFSSLPVLPWASERVGNIDNPSYISFPFSDFPLVGEITFLKRLYSTAVYVTAKAYHKLYWQPMANELARKYFGEGTPSVQDIAARTSLILTFSHFSMTAARPLVPNVIEVGGIHLKPPSTLPKAIDKFMNSTTDGVIYFCLGSLLQAETMPDNVRTAFVDAFKQIPQRVLWKWEKDELPGKSNNVMIKKWMPQRDILAHHNIKLFITHGGALGLNEAVFEGVPVLGIPFYGDQKANLKSLQAAGAGEILWYDQISSENIVQKIKIMLNETSYQFHAKRLSTLYVDRPVTPLNSAIYWTEYIVRHGGAGHLKSAAIQLSWYQYLLLDVIAFLSLVLFVVIYLVKLVISKILNLILGRSPKPKPKKHKAQ